MRTRKHPNRCNTTLEYKYQIMDKPDRAVLTDKDFEFLIRIGLKDIAIKEYMKHDNRSN